MPRRARTGRVIVSNHAYGRYVERIGPIKPGAMAHLVRTCLASQLRLGKEAKGAAVEVFLNENVRAVVEPDIQGYWICKTLLGENEPGFY
jgi:hypothetical protein